MSFTKLPLAIVATVLSFMFAGPAWADLELCNNDSESHSFAIAYKSDGNWVSEGWWTAKAGTCKTVIKGNLKQRYYYYRATSGGDAVHEGKYRFCVAKKAFTITGEANCKSRGYTSASFASIDTGKKAKDFKFVLKTDVNQKDEEQAPIAITPDKLPFKRGSLGEPYTVTGILQGCEENDGRSYCAYHAEGWKHFAYAGEGTLQTILDDLQRIGPGTAISFVGDMISFGDITAQVAIAKYEFAEKDKHADLREKMQGNWYSLDDDAGYIIINGAEQKDIYDANLAGEYYLQWRDECEGSRGLGPVLLAIDPENRESPICHFIVSVDEKKMVLSYVGGNGQDKTYVTRN